MHIMCIKRKKQQIDEKNIFQKDTKSKKQYNIEMRHTKLSELAIG